MVVPQLYDIDLTIKFGPLSLIDIDGIRKQAPEGWSNRTLCQVNDSVVRLGSLKSEFHWHKHDREDEFFLDIDGELFIDIEGGATVALKPHQGYVVPKGVVHRIRAPKRTAILMVESATVLPTGDA
jgi:mannose-6-phosphate isomerase-like protein (cupin superfamily)